MQLYLIFQDSSHVFLLETAFARYIFFEGRLKIFVKHVEKVNISNIWENVHVLNDIDRNIKNTVFKTEFEKIIGK